MIYRIISFTILLPLFVLCSCSKSFFNKTPKISPIKWKLEKSCCIRNIPEDCYAFNFLFYSNRHINGIVFDYAKLYNSIHHECKLVSDPISYIQSSKEFSNQIIIENADGYVDTFSDNLGPPSNYNKINIDFIVFDEKPVRYFSFPVSLTKDKLQICSIYASDSIRLHYVHDPPKKFKRLGARKEIITSKWIDLRTLYSSN